MPLGLICSYITQKYLYIFKCSLSGQFIFGSTIHSVTVNLIILSLKFSSRTTFNTYLFWKYFDLVMLRQDTGDDLRWNLLYLSSQCFSITGAPDDTWALQASESVKIRSQNFNYRFQLSRKLHLRDKQQIKHW